MHTKKKQAGIQHLRWSYGREGYHGISFQKILYSGIIQNASMISLPHSDVSPIIRKLDWGYDGMKPYSFDSQRERERERERERDAHTHTQE